MAKRYNAIYIFKKWKTKVEVENEDMVREYMSIKRDGRKTKLIS